MTDYTFEISCPSAEHLEVLKKRFGECKKARESASRKVLGHAVEEEGWIIFNEILMADYSRMLKLLKVLDERAG